MVSMNAIIISMAAFITSMVALAVSLLLAINGVLVFLRLNNGGGKC